ncbi:shikimate dehydrogenase [Sulfitobacter sp. D35]|uniref:shikimate dehydrogenase family protein n=1 Tax=Sulfitobacter sp. D35 TaxID=3083252 RepID=UPI00296E76B7|nr:shikimate dehydrogenase [Sulfitobacter sp. D35]MDW4497420.1 shikimate dehydrogenase [Sulfitobacter sp. D35]
MSTTPDLLLGLIGDNIARSQAPLLHRLAGRQNGLAVRYDRLVPRDLGQSFEEVFDGCAPAGYRGINVTYPYKELASARVRIDDPLVRVMGAVNTVIFDPEGPRGHNTDFTGFQAAYARVRGDAAPGAVLLIGAGGVGRAIAFALAGLGAREIRLCDREPGKAKGLAKSIAAAAPDAVVSIHEHAEAAADGVAGVVNCTPVGMSGYEGTPLDGTALAGAEWAFDAVYTPRDTQFLRDSASHGLGLLSGWELFFHQGVHAWSLFSGRPVDETALRDALLRPSEDA